MNALLSPGNMTSQMHVLAVPCNQFGHQEPGANATEILATLKYVRPGGGFTVSPHVTMLKKADVNGEREIPVYKYLKESCPPPAKAYFRKSESFWEPLAVSDVTWNFEKFLVSAQGVPLFRFLPKVEPFDLQPLISLLTSPAENFVLQQIQLKKILAEIDDVIHSRLNQ